MVGFLKLASLAALAALPVAQCSDLFVLNNCNFNIFCAGAKNDGTSTVSTAVKGNGGTYKSPLLANDDNIGSVLKCSKNADMSKPFQMELAVQNGRSWFDLSAEDADPFVTYHRHAEIAGQCVLDCPPGSTSCEYPVQPDCLTTEDAWMTLC
ncbi:hypothetical protein M426DRAFT_24048 [Hypoxylon sp. CI-4A]|nr:hypothetical protein M426DRAFT_24048 [Hypoxylon sp. CI-4A]